MFEKKYGGVYSEAGNATIQSSDGGFVSVGSTNSFGAGNSDVYILKTSESGVKLWTKTFGGINDDFGTDIKQTQDNGYIISGYTNSFGNGGFDIYIIKIDVDANLVWSHVYGGSGDDEGHAILKKANEYVVTGRTSSFGAGGFDACLISVNDIGNTNWFKVFGGQGDEAINAIVNTTDNGFLLAGCTSGFGEGNKDVYLIKSDSVGNKIWSNVYGEGQDDYASSVIQTSDGNYMISGTTRSFGLGLEDVIIMKTNIHGDLLWEATYGGIGSDKGNDICEANDGGFFITGETQSFTGNPDVLLIKLSEYGLPEFTRTFGDSGIETGRSIHATTDQGYIVTGVVNEDIYLIKVNAAGKTLCSSYPEIDLSVSGMQIASPADVSPNVFLLNAGNAFTTTGTGGYAVTNCFSTAPVIEGMSTKIIPISNDFDYTSEEMRKTENLHKTSNSISFNVFPNPNDGVNFNISIESDRAEEILVVVYDQLGRERYSKIIITEENSNNIFAVDPSENLSPGIYMVTATSAKETLSKRLIVK